MNKLERTQYLINAYQQNGRTVKDALGSACMQIADYEERIDDLSRDLSVVVEDNANLRIENDQLKAMWQREHDDLVRTRERLVLSETMYHQYINREQETDCE